MLDRGYTDGESYGEDPMYDIDYPVDTIDVNVTNFYQGPRLTSEQLHSLPDDAKKTWICSALKLTPSF